MALKMVVYKRDIAQLFRELRAAQIYAEENLACCSSCSIAEIEAHAPLNTGAVYYHEQDIEDAYDPKTGFLTKPLAIRYVFNYGPSLKDEKELQEKETCALAKTVIKIANEIGLITEWDGDIRKVIFVKP